MPECTGYCCAGPYRSIPTLREYIVVSHRERRIIVHTRQSSGNWAMTVGIRGDTVEVASLGVRLAVDEVYRHSAIP